MTTDIRFTPLISVVMPTYNHARYISEAITSVLKQTYGNLELIIIDNYSEDNTEAIVKSFADEDNRIRYQKFRNKGVIAASRNEGIKLACGEYIAFIDSDDSWLPNKLERVMRVFDQNRDVDLVCHNEYHVSGDDNKVIMIGKYGPHKKYRDMLFKGNSISTSAVVVRRDKVLKAGLFSEQKEFILAEDYELWLRLSEICKITYLHEVLGNWRTHATSLSGNIERHTANILNVVNYHFKQWPKRSFYYNYLMNKRRGAVMRIAGRAYLKAGEYKSAKSYLASAFALDPFSIKTWIVIGASVAKVKI
jgi:glycosyltransferase involved in cell wall biosynthesis